MNHKQRLKRMTEDWQTVRDHEDVEALRWALAEVEKLQRVREILGNCESTGGLDDDDYNQLLKAASPGI